MIRGNVTSLGGIDMNYDATDRPTGLSGDESGAYRYDGHNRRVKSVIANGDGTSTTRYNVYDASGSLAYVVQLAPGTADDHVTNYIKMDGKTVARVKSIGTRLNYTDEVTYLHHDHLGSAVAGTDDTGAILWTEQYTPFGISLVNNAANDNQAGFTGHIKDTDTGLTYMQARYYDPVIGRFLSHDPVQFSVEQPLMFNRYGYVGGNPINATDPTGMLKCEGDERCASIHQAASDARTELMNEWKDLDELIDASVSGEQLSTAQVSTKQKFEEMFGSGSATIENLVSVSNTIVKIHDQIGVEGEGSSIKFSDQAYGNAAMTATLNGDQITVHPGYNSAALKANAYAISHEVGHNIGMSDLLLPSNTPASVASHRIFIDQNGNVIRKAYGQSGARYLAQKHPSMALNNNDNYQCLVFGGNCG
ncbi:MAG: hypothetical protein HKN36_06400 [Hellea sp.]|nr:hypothetical protein [Hellea sp.]